VYGSKATKDAAGVMRALFGGADTVILTQAGDPPTSDPALLATPAREGGYAGDLVIEADAVKALRVARSRAGAAGLVCITGSMYLVGALRTVLGLAPGQKG
jgi:dihydrofolate synthase / folylpolyglutamate synthase